MEEINEKLRNRLELVQKKVSANVTAFAKSINDTQPQTMMNYLKGIRKVPSELLVEVLMVYPQISAEWLMRGEGSILKSDNSVPGTPYHEDEYVSLREELANLKGRHEQLKEIFDGLYEIVKKNNL